MAEPRMFLIFAHARTGSDNLCNALDRHPDINVLNEPFNPNHPSWHAGNIDYRSRITDVASLREQLRLIGRSHRGLKTLDWNLPRDLNDTLLTDEGMPLLFLRRRNALRAIVSHWIACQTNVWQVWHAKRPLAEHYGSLPPAPVAELRSVLTEFVESMARYEDVVTRRAPGSYRMVTYEELYQSPEPRRRALFDQIVGFFDHAPVAYDRVADFLGPRGRLNTAATYARIPNAVELDDALGDDTTGWLLGRADATDGDLIA